MARVTKHPDGCWVYEGTPRRNGYAYVYVGRNADGRKRQRGVHQVALEDHLSRLLRPGEMALHGCDVKLCVRVGPGHLYPGTHADNMADRDRRGRTTRGTAKPQAKLSPEAIARGHHLRAGGMSYRAIGLDLGVSAPTAWKALTGKTWRNGLPPTREGSTITP